jgi:hypothetical protein
MLLMTEAETCYLVRLRAVPFGCFLLYYWHRCASASRAQGQLHQWCFNPSEGAKQPRTLRKLQFFGRGVADTKLRAAAAAQLATGRRAGHGSRTVSLYLAHVVIMKELTADCFFYLLYLLRI